MSTLREGREVCARVVDGSKVSVVVSEIATVEGERARIDNFAFSLSLPLFS